MKDGFPYVMFVRIDGVWTWRDRILIMRWFPGLLHIPTTNEKSLKKGKLETRSVESSGETLCRDNCQLIGMPYIHTRSAGKNNRN